MNRRLFLTWAGALGFLATTSAPIASAAPVASAIPMAVTGSAAADLERWLLSTRKR